VDIVDKKFQKNKFTIAFLMATLIFLIGLFLNLQVLIATFFDRSYLSNIWVVLPVLLLILYVPRYALNAGVTSPSFLTTFFLLILSLHVAIQSFAYGIVAGAWSFTSYGLWIGLFIWLQYAKFNLVRSLVIFMFLSFGILHLCTVLVEYAIGESFFKTVTLGDGVERNYGISTSVSILGLQFAVGAIVSTNLYFQAKNKTIKFLGAVFFILMTFALFTLSIRGPLFYLIITLAIFSLHRLKLSPGKYFQVFAFICMGVFTLGYLFYSSENFLSFFLDAFSLADEGNLGRIDKYILGLEMLVQDWWVPLVGHGSAELSQVPLALGKPDLTLESSTLRGLLELGIIGMFPILLLITLTIYGFLRCARVLVVKRNVEFFAILMVLLLQCTTHETFKTWIGSFYFVVSLGICVRVLMEAGFFKRPKHIRIFGKEHNRDRDLIFNE